jgi:hypothetical protein
MPNLALIRGAHKNVYLWIGDLIYMYPVLKTCLLMALAQGVSSLENDYREPCIFISSPRDTKYDRRFSFDMDYELRIVRRDYEMVDGK